MVSARLRTAKANHGLDNVLRPSGERVSTPFFCCLATGADHASEWGLGAALQAYMARVHAPALMRRGVQGFVLALFATTLLAGFAMLPRISRCARPCLRLLLSRSLSRRCRQCCSCAPVGPWGPMISKAQLPSLRQKPLLVFGSILECTQYPFVLDEAVAAVVSCKPYSVTQMQGPGAAGGAAAGLVPAGLLCGRDERHARGATGVLRGARPQHVAPRARHQSRLLHQRLRRQLLAQSGAVTCQV